MALLLLESLPHESSILRQTREVNLRNHREKLQLVSTKTITVSQIGNRSMPTITEFQTSLRVTTTMMASQTGCKQMTTTTTSQTG